MASSTLFLVAFAATITFVSQHSSAQVINPSLEASITAKGSANVIVTFRAGTADVLSPLINAVFPNREARLLAVTSALIQNAARIQTSALQLLASLLPTSQYTSLWITNEIAVKGVTRSLLSSLTGIADISQIIEDVRVTLPIDFIEVRPGPRPNERSPQPVWSVQDVEAPQSWRQGATGAGIVIGNIDTGARYTHEALRPSYRGFYGWYDPYKKTALPSDEEGHGTHTIGTHSGQFGIGVAPGSKWIACKGCSDENCTLSGLLECGQFMLCPHLPDGSLRMCGLAPHVVSCSWGGDGGLDFYDGVLQAWTAAGIIPIFSIGNNGPDCGSATAPGDSPQAIGVGATDKSNELPEFSSSGPTVVRERVKPDVVAPGRGILSAWSSSDTSYQYLTGTSMACPNVAGVVAILLSSVPRNGNSPTFDQIKQYLQEEAGRNLTLSADREDCGGRSNSNGVFPNNAVGYGKVNAFRSMSAVRQANGNSGGGVRVGLGPINFSIRK